MAGASFQIIALMWLSLDLTDDKSVIDLLPPGNMGYIRDISIDIFTNFYECEIHFLILIPCIGLNL